MKVFVALAFCLVAVSCSEHSGEVSSDEEHTPLTVQEFKDEMNEALNKANENSARILGFRTQALADDDLERVGRQWGEMVEDVDQGMNEAAHKLAMLGMRMWMEGPNGNFGEENFCDDFKDLHQVPFDENDFDGSVAAFKAAVADDLRCLADEFAKANEIKQEIANLGENVSERYAGELIGEALHKLHVLRLNAWRFREVVEREASRFGGGGDPSTRELLMTLRELLMKN